MSDHTLDITFDEGARASLICAAPADALCRAVWVCECESIGGYEVIDGSPTHKGDEHRAPHVGQFVSDACNYRDWFDEGEGIDEVSGRLSVDIEADWQGDYYEFNIPEATQ